MIISIKKGEGKKPKRIRGKPQAIEQDVYQSFHPYTTINQNMVTDEEYKVKECGKIVEVQRSSNVGRRKKKESIRKISNEQYVILSTGEIKEFKQKVVKNEDNARSMRRALGKCRDIINTNVMEEEKVICYVCYKD